MSKLKDGGPAFPQTDCALPPNSPYSGMSLRTWLAGMAMQGIMVHGARAGLKELASDSCDIADALIAELEKEVV